MGDRRLSVSKTAPSTYLDSPAALEDLRALNARFIHNFVTNDVTSHDALLHRDFLVIQGNGSRLDRATYLERWATGFDPAAIPYWDVRDELITLVGNVALVRSTNKYVMHRDGRDVSGMAVYTDTYLYEAGRWQCIQAQITPVSKEHEPGEDTIVTTYVGGVRQGKRA
jgi:hypothetical protein